MTTTKRARRRSTENTLDNATAVTQSSTNTSINSEASSLSLINAANKLYNPLSQFLPQMRVFSPPTTTRAHSQTHRHTHTHNDHPDLTTRFSIDCVSAPHLPSTLKSQLFALLETNMKHMYEQSNWGWSGTHKHAEMFYSSPVSWFLIASCVTASAEQQQQQQQPDERGAEATSKRRRAGVGSTTGLCSDELLSGATTAVGGGGAGELCGFVHFKFDMDLGEPVLYLYEIQLEAARRGCGLGGHLVRILLGLAGKTRMRRVTATVFQFNTASRLFFDRLGFVEQQQQKEELEVEEKDESDANLQPEQQRNGKHREEPEDADEEEEAEEEETDTIILTKAVTLED